MNIRASESNRYYSRSGSIRLLDTEQRIDLVYDKFLQSERQIKAWKECLASWPNYQSRCYFPLLYSDVGCDKTRYHIAVDKSKIFYWHKQSWRLLELEEANKLIETLKQCYDWIR